MTHRTYDDATGLEARQGLLDNRCERTHPKRHRTQKRAKRLAARKRAATAHRAAAALASARRYHAAVAAFWRGERPEHPGASA